MPPVGGLGWAAPRLYTRFPDEQAAALVGAGRVHDPHYPNAPAGPSAASPMVLDRVAMESGD